MFIYCLFVLNIVTRLSPCILNDLYSAILGLVLSFLNCLMHVGVYLK